MRCKGTCRVEGEPRNFLEEKKGENDRTRADDGGADGDRTHDLMNAIHALSQLSYSPTREKSK
jgi:hypothetical protein